MATSKTQPTVTLKHISAALAEARGIAKKEAEGVLNETVDLLVKHLKKGDRIRIAGFGILQVKKRPARMGRNPATGEAIRIKASKKARITPVKAFKDAVLAPANAPKLVKGAYPTLDTAVAAAGKSSAPVAAKAPARKTTAKKAAARRTPAKKTAARKTTARRVPAVA